MHSFPGLCTSKRAWLNINPDHLECSEFINSRTSVNYTVPTTSTFQCTQSLENHPEGGKPEDRQPKLSRLEINDWQLILWVLKYFLIMLVTKETQNKAKSTSKKDLTDVIIELFVTLVFIAHMWKWSSVPVQRPLQCCRSITGSEKRRWKRMFLGGEDLQQMHLRKWLR